MLATDVLTKAGIPEKAAQLYMALLSHGPASVRRIAQVCGINRGSAYDYLKQLQDVGLVTHFHKKTMQHFVAEHPSTVQKLLEHRVEALSSAKAAFEKTLPELEALYHSGGAEPIARYIDRKDLRALLEDVLASCVSTGVSLYRIYSAEAVRPYLYESFPSFSDERIKKGIRVRSVAFGAAGVLRGLDERRLLSSAQTIPTYIIIYPKKTAYISLSQTGEPVGVVIENDGISTMQTTLFDALWDTLPKSL